MPVEIDIGKPPAGYTLTSVRPNEEVEIQFLEFTSTEDGQHFIQRLEGFPSQILEKLPTPIYPSQVGSMLAVIHGDGKTTVYINELSLRAVMRTSKSIKKGEAVMRSDIVDIDRLDFEVQIPEDAGFVFIFSIGWRKGLYYDLGPLGGPDSEPRQYDVGAVLGQAYCHVMFQERFSIAESEWQALFAAKWFPFAGLGNESIDALIAHVRAGWDPDEKQDDFVGVVKERATQMLESWRNHSSFTPHIEILESAVGHFHNDDFLSCAGLLFPRIEGLLRTHHTSLETSERPSPDNLAGSAVAAKIDNTKCLLMPHRFSDYLRNIYFADFNPDDENIEVSRHSVAHGVASTSDFNQKSALLAILVVHQLFYFLENQKDR